MRAWLAIPALLAACADKGDTGFLVEGPHALGFGESSSCAAARVVSSAFPQEGTFEAWVKADPGVPYAGHPLVVWDGAAALWEHPDGYIVMSDASGELAGATYPGTVMDQGLHHVAGTWSTGELAIYVDGLRAGFSTASTVGSTPGSTLYLGCWPGQSWVHVGLLDEVRVSGTVRYTESFAPPQGPFEEDADTLHLWHLDEGIGDTSADAAGGATMDLDRISWVPFELTGR